MPPRAGGPWALQRALHYLRAHRAAAGGALSALLLVSAANLATPQLIRMAIDVGFAQRQPRVLVQVVVGLVGPAIVRSVFTFLQGYLAERASQGVAYELREALFAQIERLSFSYYDRTQTGQLMTRVTNDVEQVRTRFVRRVGPLFGKVQQLLGRLNTILQEDLSAIRVIRAFGREQYEINRYAQANGRLLEKTWRPCVRRPTTFL